MKILHQQQGGLLIYTPFIRETPQQTTSTASKTSEDKSSNEIEKAIFKVLENNTGLPNDVDLFLSKANSLLVSPPGFDQSYNISDLIKLHSLANKIKHNQTAHANASKRLDTEDAGAEVAITVNGGLYVQDDEGNLKTISAESYYKNSDKYRLLTNTDLINIREYSPSLAYNTSILNDLAGVEGMKSIVEYMKTTINAFGTDTITDKSNRFTVKEKGKIEKGFESILDGVAPDGIYKVTTTNKITDQGYNKSTNEGLVEAATYLWSTLNPRQKNTIRAHTAAEGLNPNDAKDVYRILISSIQEHTDHGFERSVDVDYDASASKAAGMDKTNSKEQQVIDTFGNWVQKNGGTYLTNDLVIEGANINFKTPAYHYNRIENSFNGEQVPVVMTGAETYQNMLGHGVVDTTRKVYFGDLPINNISVTGDEILIDTFKGGRVVYLPVDSSGNVDFELYRVMNTIQEEIISDNITDPKHQQQIWEDNGFDYNPVAKIGSPKGYTLRRYWMQPASTSTAADIFDKKSLKGSNFIGKSSDNSKLENLVLKYNNDPLNKNKSKIDIAPGWFGEAYDGMLLIPMNYEQDEAMMAGKIAYTNKENVDNLNAYQQAVQRGNGYGPNRSINGLSSYDLD